jgi:hypothetical protein
VRVTVEHREKTSGLLQNRKEYYVDCRVEFSEEERSIIKERNLYRNGFPIRTSTPVPGQASILGTMIMRLVSPLMIVGGIIYGIAGGGGLSGLLVLGGIGLFIAGWIREHRQDRRLATDEQFVTINQLLDNPTFTVYAGNPAAARGFEEDVRENVTDLKQLIKNSAELRNKQTFEL